MKKIASILSTVLIITLLVLIAAIGAPKVFGIRIFTVLSPSMAPEYQPGDLVYTVPTDAKEIEVGDVVTFVMNEKLDVATHRVISKDENSESFVTKGDANNNEDGAILAENIVGVVRFKIPKAGFALNYFSSTAGRIIGITVVLTFTALIFLFSSGKEEAKDKKPKKNKERDI